MSGQSRSSGFGGATIIQVALNGGRSRTQHPAVPCTPEEIADDAEACLNTGASVVHIHAQTTDGDWLADPDVYARSIRLIRERAPELPISITSIRPDHRDVSLVIDLIHQLSRQRNTTPDLMSINLGHITKWEPDPASESGRSTVHFPNSWEDITALLGACADAGIVPELGLMDLGFVSNAVLLRDSGWLPDPAWFLIEFDNPASGGGSQLAPSTPANYDLFAGLLREHFPGSAWAAHGADLPSFDVVTRAIETGGHVRVGIEDSITLPDRPGPTSNVEQVEWAARVAAKHRRRPATPSEARAIIGLPPYSG